MDVKWRLWLAWALLIGSLVGWPITAFTFASGEPQFILGLSWLAVALTALDILATQDVRKQQDDDEEE